MNKWPGLISSNAYIYNSKWLNRISNAVKFIIYVKFLILRLNFYACIATADFCRFAKKYALFEIGY